MQARTEQAQPLTRMNSTDVGINDGRKSAGELVRLWAPYILTALIVPGGIAIALLLLFRRWNQRRQMVANPARA